MQTLAPARRHEWVRTSGATRREAFAAGKARPIAHPEEPERTAVDVHRNPGSAEVVKHLLHVFVLLELVDESEHLDALGFGQRRDRGLGYELCIR